MNNYQIPLLVLTTDRTEQVLVKIFRHLNLTLEFMPYFSLFLIKKDNSGDITILRKLQDFESPYISFKTVRDANRIVLRKRQVYLSLIHIYEFTSKAKAGQISH